MTGTVAYILSKKIAMGVASGIANISLQGTTLIFNFKDGTQSSISIPLPKDGVDGKDGLSIIKVEINDNNHLICTMSDNSTIDAGELPGKETGSGVIQVKDKASLPIKGEEDKLYLTIDDGTLYYWNNEYKAITSSSSCGCGDIGLATDEDIDSLFDDDSGDTDLGLGLATNEDIDSLFE